MGLDTAAWEKMLGQTLDDGKRSTAERQALRATLKDAALDDRNRAMLRSRVFEIAREKLNDDRYTPTVDWLEELSKLLLPFSGESGEPFVEARFSPGEGCVRRIRGLLESARRTADICVFTITDDRIAEAILAAHQRGVVVRVSTDDERARDVGSDAIAMARAGIPVRVDDSSYHMHHKFAILDGDTMLTGSYNGTRGAAQNNEENLILSNDRRLLTAFKGEFERLWAKFANNPI